MMIGHVPAKGFITSYAVAIDTDHQCHNKL